MGVWDGYLDLHASELILLISVEGKEITTTRYNKEKPIIWYVMSTVVVVVVAVGKNDDLQLSSRIMHGFPR
jgi:hypothetical protein